MSGMGSQKFSTEIRHIHQIRSADAVPDLDHLPSQMGGAASLSHSPGRSRGVSSMRPIMLAVETCRH
jgi:hypothetical protein